MEEGELKTQYSPPDSLCWFFLILEKLFLSWGKCIKHNAHNNLGKNIPNIIKGCWTLLDKSAPQLFLISVCTFDICSDGSQQRFTTEGDLTWGWVGRKAARAGVRLWLQQRSGSLWGVHANEGAHGAKENTDSFWGTHNSPLLACLWGCFGDCWSWKLNYKPQTWHWECNVSSNTVSVVSHPLLG